MLHSQSWKRQIAAVPQYATRHEDMWTYSHRLYHTEVCCQFTYDPLTSRQQVPDTHSVGGWVGHRTGIDTVKKGKSPRLSRIEIKLYWIHATSLLTTVTEPSSFFVRSDSTLLCINAHKIK